MHIQILGTLGGSASVARAINDAGHVVGEADTTDGSSHAYFWTSDDGIYDLGTAGYLESSAVGINAHDEVIGQLRDDQRNDYPFLWTSADGIRNLEPDRGVTEAIGITDAGQVYLHSFNEDAPEVLQWSLHEGLRVIAVPDNGAEWSGEPVVSRIGALAGKLFYHGPMGGWQLFTWISGVPFHPLSLPASITEELFNCDITGISGAGHVAGWYREEGGPTKAVLWSPLPPPPPLQDTPERLLIHDLTHGREQRMRYHARRQTYVADHRPADGTEVLIYAVTNCTGEMHAYRVTPPPEEYLRRELDTSGWAVSHACAVNDAGHVVGYVESAGGAKQACFWTGDGSLHTLETLGNQESVALAINTTSQIVGWAKDGNGQINAVLWQ